MEQREYSDEIKRRLKQFAESDLYQKRGPRSDFVGLRYGDLVIQRAVGHTPNGRVIVLSHCDCGGARIGTLDSLKSGVVSCGCRQEKQKPALKKQRQFDSLLQHTINKIKLPVQAAKVEQLPHTEDINAVAIHAVVAVTNLSERSQISHSAESAQASDT